MNNFYYPNYYQPQQSNDERIWVNGINAAEAYLVAPNSFVRLWDSQMNRFYEKRADASGRPMPLEVFEYSRIEAQNNNSLTVDYQKEIDSLKARISALEGVSNVQQSNANDTGIPEI